MQPLRKYSCLKQSVFESIEGRTEIIVECVNIPLELVVDPRNSRVLLFESKQYLRHLFSCLDPQMTGKVKLRG